MLDKIYSRSATISELRRGPLWPGMNLVERGPIGTFVANRGRAAYFLGGTDGGG